VATRPELAITEFGAELERVQLRDRGISARRDMKSIIE
jgi:hypothetical protein